MQSDHWGGVLGDPMVLLGRILERTEATSEAVADIAGRVNRIETRLVQGGDRMRRIEDGQKPKLAEHWIIVFLKDVESLRGWLIGAAIVIAALKGILSPEEIKVYLLGLGLK